jgi:site-specific DNA-methyltransferase (adenine-specific)
MENKLSYTTKEVAQILGVSTSTIYRMEKKGLLASTKTPGGQRRFQKSVVDEYLKLSKDFEAPQNPSQFKNKNFVLNEEIKEYLNDNYCCEPYFSTEKIKIYNADILKINTIDENSIDLIVTSPPYNVDIKYNSHNDCMSYDDYLEFTYEWLKKCFNFLKDDGRMCLNIPLDKNKGGQQSVCADVTVIAKKIGYKYHSTIIWNEQNISRRTAWGSWLSATAPYVIAPVEVILVLYKKEWKKKSGSNISDITKKEFIEWTNGVWTFCGESKKRIGHPAPFPVELPRRCIKLFSFINDTILDPFMGSGSTLIACLQTSRFGIGIDIDKKYCELAKNRLIIEGKIEQYDLIKT